ncbi:MAG TPA: MFS transporter [Gemmatimonadales bacterium]|nr:MFS transporter [Gemmatimonadales bacterium]
MTVGAQVQTLVVSWQIYGITHDPLSLGLIGLAEVVPFVAVALVAGHVADRFDRRRIALWSLAVLLACALALVALSESRAWEHAHGVWPFYLVIAVGGLARSFLMPARNSLAVGLIPPAMLPNSIAWRSSTWQTGAVAGPALGGLLYGFAGVTATYAVQAALILVALVSFAMIDAPSGAAAAGSAPAGDSLLSGLRFVWRERALLGAQTLDLFSVLLGGAEALLPVFADRILHVGPEGLGLLRAAPAAGAVLMSLTMAHRPPFRRAGRSLLLAVASFAVCIVGFGLSRSFALSAALLLVSGMADNVSVLIRQTMLQVLTPPALLGRVIAVNSIFVGSSNELGAFESGVTARLLGAVPAVVLGGVASLAVVGVVAATVPRLRRMREIRT